MLKTTGDQNRASNTEKLEQAHVTAASSAKSPEVQTVLC